MTDDRDDEAATPDGAAAGLDRDSLTVYLEDHLAGSHGALRLMTDVAEATSDPTLATFLRDLHREVEDDRERLEAVIDQLGVSTSRVKRAVSTVVAAAGHAQLHRPGTPDGLARLLELEALSAGISAKMLVWRSLAATSIASELDGIDLERLIGRAQGQLDDLEPHRAAAARAALERSPD